MEIVLEEKTIQASFAVVSDQLVIECFVQYDIYFKNTMVKSRVIGNIKVKGASSNDI